MLVRIFAMGVFCAASVWTLGAANAQTHIKVTLTTNGPVGLAPAFVAFHDGGYDLFDVGASASGSLESLAEVGVLDGAIADANAAGANTAGFAPGGPFAPNGGSGDTVVPVDAANTWLTFGAMVLPSNDWFIGTGDALDVSALVGAAPGASLEWTFSTIYDAGTETEDFAFAPGGGLVGVTTASDPAGGTATANPISVVNGPDPFAVFANIEPMGFDTTSIDFTSGVVGTLTLEVVPEPATGLLMLCGVMALGVARRR